MNAEIDVLLPQEWLRDAVLAQKPRSAVKPSFRLLPHCTERTNATAATGLWAEIFAKAGLSLTMPASGRCGMSGTYGHEARNRDTSADIFALSWARHVDQARPGEAGHGELLATGYSCRCQVKRMRGERLRHPIEALLDLYNEESGQRAPD